ncbi:MAG: sigma-70 family RNA polymerase sigma factor [Pseudomonadota bacterium]
MTVPKDTDWVHLRQSLSAVVRRRGVAPDDVEDVVQSALERALRNLERLEQAEKFEPWVKQIAANAAIDRLRAQQRQPRSEDLPDHLPALVDTPDTLLSYADCVASFLSLLPEADAAALRAKDINGVSFADLAAEIGLTIPGAKSRVQRARRRLAAALTRCCTSLAGASPEPFEGDCNPCCD